MRSLHEQRDGKDSSPAAELNLLSEMERTPEATQRSLAKQMGVSLGLTNLVVRNVARKGYVRVLQAGWRRRFYALTPAGLIRQIQLTLGYVNPFGGDYQHVKLLLRNELESQSLNAESRVAMYGDGDFGQLVYLGLRDLGIDEIDIFGPGNMPDAKFVGMPVQDVSTLRAEEYDRVVVARLGSIGPILADLNAQGVPSEKLVSLFQLDSQPANPIADPGLDGVESR